MRVVHVIPVMDPATGGPPPVVGAVCSLLRSAGTDASVVCYETWKGDGGADRTREMMAGIPGGNGVPIACLPALTKSEVWTAASARRLLPDHLRGADLVHLHGVWDPVVLTAAKAAGAQGVPYVISTHGMLEPWAVRKRWKKELFWRFGWGKMLQGAAGIHDYRPGPISVLGRELKPRVFEIANGIFPGDARSNPESDAAWARVCSRFPRLRGKRIVLFLSRLAKQKGASHLAGAFIKVKERFPDVELLMAGREEDWLDGYRMKETLRPVPVLTGGLFGEEKAAAMAHAEIFVLPSLHEGFSVAVLEAMGFGLPCVISEACHFERARAAGAAEIVSSAEHRELQLAIERLLADPESGKKMGRRGKELVEREYTWGAIVPKYLDMYEALVPGDWRREEHAPPSEELQQPPTWGAGGSF